MSDPSDNFFLCVSEFGVKQAVNNHVSLLRRGLCYSAGREGGCRSPPPQSVLPPLPLNWSGIAVNSDRIQLR